MIQPHSSAYPFPSHRPGPGADHRRQQPGVALLLLATVLLVGCSATGGSVRGAPVNTITNEQIQRVDAMDTYEVVRQLRSSWLRPRGRISIADPTAGSPVVYVDQIRYGPVGSLRQLSRDVVDRIEYIDPRDATTRFGTNHAGGVIMVWMKR